MGDEDEEEVEKGEVAEEEAEKGEAKEAESALATQLVSFSQSTERSPPRGFPASSSPPRRKRARSARSRIEERHGSGGISASAPSLSSNPSGG